MKTVSTEKFIAALRKIKGAKIVTGDIETFPIEGLVWRTFKQNLSVEQITKDYSLMSCAFKISGTNTFWYMDNRDAMEPRDHYALLKEVYDILSEVDIIVAHNGARFDMRMLRGFFAMEKFRPLRPVKVIDTLLQNAQQFGFVSQKLAYVSKYFASQQKDDHGKYPGWKLWLGCLNDELAAWNACKKYNLQDVQSNDEMYIELRPWYTGAVNLGAYAGPQEEGVNVCDVCGSTHVHQRGPRPTQVGIYARLHCQECGHWGRGRVLLASRKERAHIMMS